MRARFPQSISLVAGLLLQLFSWPGYAGEVGDIPLLEVPPPPGPYRGSHGFPGQSQGYRPMPPVPRYGMMTPPYYGVPPGQGNYPGAVPAQQQRAPWAGQGAYAAPPMGTMPAAPREGGMWRW